MSGFSIPAPRPAEGQTWRRDGRVFGISSVIGGRVLIVSVRQEWHADVLAWISIGTLQARFEYVPPPIDEVRSQLLVLFSRRHRRLRMEAAMGMTFLDAERRCLLHVLRRRLGPEPTQPVHALEGHNGRDFYRRCDGMWDQAGWNPPPTCVGVGVGESGALYAIDNVCVTCAACRDGSSEASS